MHTRLLVGGLPLVELCVLMLSVSFFSRMQSRVTLSSTEIECVQRGV